MLLCPLNLWLPQVCIYTLIQLILYFLSEDLNWAFQDNPDEKAHKISVHFHFMNLVSLSYLYYFSDDDADLDMMRCKVPAT